jgi:hypothetical protein
MKDNISSLNQWQQQQVFKKEIKRKTQGIYALIYKCR